MKLRLLHKPLSAVCFCLALALSGIMTGCHDQKEQDLIETVPADARMVATLNVEELLRNAGCQVSDGQIRLTDDVKTIIESLPTDRQAALMAITAIAPTVDMTRMIAFVTADNKPVLAFSIVDEDSFATLASAGADSTGDEGSLTVYNFKGCVVATDQSRGWVATDISDIVDAIDNTDDNRFDQLNGVADMLEDRDNALAVTIRRNAVYDRQPAGADGSDTDDRWLCARLEFNRSIADLDLFVIDNEGQYFDLSPYIEPIDTDFLRFVPENSELVAAVGRLSSVNEIYESVRPYLSGGARSEIEPLISYLTAIDGTTSIAVNPAARAQYLKNLDLDSWDVTLMTHLPEKETNSLLTMARMFGYQAGFTTDTGDNSTIEFKNGSATYYLGSVDGYLIASTRPVSGNCNNSFNDVFSGKLAAFVIDVPFGGETMKALDLPWGIYCSLGVGDNNARFKLRLNGTDLSAFEGIISIIARDLSHDGSSNVVAAYDDFSDDPEYSDLEPIE